MTLSPKAARFIEIAMQEIGDGSVRAIWDRRDRDVGGGVLSDAVARAALAALQQFEHRIHMRLEARPLDEDDASDLSNDLGFVNSIKSDLIKKLGGRAS
jgi:hypothetical protein